MTVDEPRISLAVPDVSLKLRCSRCGRRSIHTRPNWLEMEASGMRRKG